MTDLAALVVRFGRIGDMVLQAPLLHLLRQRFGLPCRLLTSGPWSSELFAEDPDVGEIWQLRSRHRPFFISPERWRLIGLLRRHQGPVYVSEDMPRHVAKTRRLLNLAGINADRCVYLVDQVRADDHWVERLLRFGMSTPRSFSSEQYPAGADDLRPTPKLHVGAVARMDCARWLHTRGFGGRPLVLIQAGNKRCGRWRQGRKLDAKAWPEDRWSGLLRFMRKSLPTACLLLCGSPGESEILRRISEASASNADVATDDLPLRRLLALLEVAHSMVAVDTGPAHMAAAVGCPLVVLYGSESTLLWSRRSPAGKQVIELGGAPNHTAAADISLHEVIESWHSILRSTDDQARGCIAGASCTRHTEPSD